METEEIKTIPKDVSWEVSFNEHNIQMAILPREKAIELLEYAHYAEKRIEELKSLLEVEREHKKDSSKF